MRRRRGTSATVRLRSERGALSMPLLLILCVAFLSYFWIWSHLANWREIRDRQLLLDECVGKQARSLAYRLQRMDRLNQTVRATRAALLVTIEPTTRASLTSLLWVQYGWLQGEHLRWNTDAILWLARRGCGEVKRALPQPYPTNPWTIEAADPIGPRPFRWKGEPHALFTLRLIALPRSARAYVFLRNRSWQSSYQKPRASPL